DYIDKGDSMPIIPAIKNEYFTYFQVQSTDGTKQSDAIRCKEQIWNALGIAMQIQGTMPPSGHWGNTNSYNCFAKKHLVASGATKDIQTKALGILKKRGKDTGLANAHANRMGKVKDLRNIHLTGVANNQKGAEAKAFNLALADSYEIYGYGSTSTDTCTFVELDGMSGDEVKAAFASSILPGDATGGDEEKKTIGVLF